jgi:hypothetical protein
MHDVNNTLKTGVGAWVNKGQYKQRRRCMKITCLALWTQDNTLSVKFYKKLGFMVTESTDIASVVELGGFQVML